MSLLWDAVLAPAVARELEETLEGARLRAVHLDHEPRNLILYFREGTLVFRLHPLHGDVSFLEPREPPSEARTLHARIREVMAPPDERLLLFQLQPYRGGAPEPLGLVVELMTNQWNALVIEVGSRRIRHVLWSRELRERTLTPGSIYRRPRPSERRGKGSPLSLDEWMELLGPVEPGRRRGALLKNVAYTSSLNAGTLLGRAMEEGGAGAETALAEGHALWLQLRSPDEVRPHVLRMPKRLQPYPLPLPGIPGDRAPTLLEAFRRAVREDDDAVEAEAALIPSELLEALEGEVERARRRTERMRAELEETPDPEPFRSRGDLILARFGQVPRGEEEATLEGFDGAPVRVELDPALPPDENAERYYEKAARVERARKRLPGLIREAEERSEELRSHLRRARAGEADPEEVRDLLPEGTLERRRDSPGRADSDEGTGLPYRKYRSSGGLEIRVGRGARRNDDLTFHHSRPDDVWLHARHAAGAHVILRWARDGNPPARDLTEAAVLAAYHSEARTSGSVPVDWTRRKYVRKPRKTPPGAVVPERISTLFVDPTSRVEKRLREE